MNNQLVKPKVKTREVTITAIVIVLLIAGITSGFYYFRLDEPNNPYLQTVLSLQGDVSRGKAIFQVNCTGCHGQNADGNVGPSLHGISKRKSRVSLINQVVRGETPPMPKFQPSAKDMADLLSYLEQL